MNQKKLYAARIDNVVTLTMIVVQFFCCLIVGGNLLEYTFLNFNSENVYIPFAFFSFFNGCLYFLDKDTFLDQRSFGKYVMGLKIVNTSRTEIKYTDFLLSNFQRWKRNKPLELIEYQDKRINILLFVKYYIYHQLMSFLLYLPFLLLFLLSFDSSDIYKNRLDTSLSIELTDSIQNEIGYEKSFFSVYDVDFYYRNGHKYTEKTKYIKGVIKLDCNITDKNKAESRVKNLIRNFFYNSIYRENGAYNRNSVGRLLFIYECDGVKSLSITNYYENLSVFSAQEM